MNLGYIDEINNFDSVKNHHFADIKVTPYHIPMSTKIGGEQLAASNSSEYILSNRLLSQ